MEEGKKKSILKIIIIVLLALILAVICVYAINTIRYRQYYKELHKPTDLGLDPNQGEYVEPEKEPKDKNTGQIIIHGNTEIKIAANETEIYTVDFYNPEANKDLYYQTFEIRLLGDDGKEYETLYQSELVEPGKHIQHITLSHTLPAGEYDAILRIQPYRMSDKTPTNTLDTKTKLIVK